MSLCVCAERKHGRLQLGTSLNKSLEHLGHEPAGTSREGGWAADFKLFYYHAVKWHSDGGWWTDAGAAAV